MSPCGIMSKLYQVDIGTKFKARGRFTFICNGLETCYTPVLLLDNLQRI